MIRYRLALATLGAALLGACAGAQPTPIPAPAPQARDTAPRPDTLARADTTPPTPAEALLAQPAPVPKTSVRFAFTGDINLGTSTLPDGVPPDDGRALLEAAHPHLAGDLIVGNFEGVLADSGESYKCGPPADSTGRATVARHGARHRPRSRSHAPPRPAVRPNCYAFRTPTHLGARLADAGFTHLNLANNHANDYGLAAREETTQYFAQRGIVTYGPLGRVAIDTVRRGDSVTVVGIVGFTTYPFAYNLLDIERSRAVVDSLRPLVDLLVVTFHGGTEGVGAGRLGGGPEFLGAEPRGDLRNWAHAVIDAGADLVVGHGPHVLRGIEFYRGRPIAYSLGNFLTYRGFSLAGPLGVTGVFQIELGGDRSFRRGRLVPMLQEPRRGPRPDPAGTALELVRRLSTDDFGPGAARITDAGDVLPP